MKTKISKLVVNRHFLYCLFAGVLLTSCDVGNLQDDLECKTSVEKEFPKAIKIIQPTGERFRWLVLDADSSLWYVETMNNFNTNVSDKERVLDLNAR